MRGVDLKELEVRLRALERGLEALGETCASWVEVLKLKLEEVYEELDRPVEDIEA
jgi:hypothetical protein